jgi:glucose-6-phosphate isomerase
VLPVAVEDVGAPEVQQAADDVLLGLLVGGEQTTATSDSAVASASPVPTARVAGPLGAQLLLWETATAVAGRLLGINPFDQPDVESAKQAARGLLEQQPEPEPAAFTDGAVEVRASEGLLDGGHDSAQAAVEALLRRLDEHGYLAVMAYLDPEQAADLTQARAALAERTGRPTTFGWGPRFLHSTGQYHKGGPPTGVFLQVTETSAGDVDIPDRPFSFGGLISAQAAGDAAVLADHGFPVLRLHLTDPVAGLRQLREVLG